MGERVQLAVYDLSRGMAASMSEAILGQRIDIIPHTSIFAFNREWYFGGGIQVSPIGFFQSNSGMAPTRLQVMGSTVKTEAQLRAFLASVATQWGANTYNLLTHNCNNFSDVVCRFLLPGSGSGIPEEIVGLPNRVFSTPIGQMLRPLIDGVQRGINADASHTFDPFGGAAADDVPAPTPVPVVPAASASAHGGFGSGFGASVVPVPAMPVPAVPVAAARVSQVAMVRAALDEAPFLSAVSDGSAAMTKRLCELRAKVAVAPAAAAVEGATASAAGTKHVHGTCSFCKRDDFLTREAYDTHELDKPCRTLLAGNGNGAGSPPAKAGTSASAGPAGGGSHAAAAVGPLLVSAAQRQVLQAAQAWIGDRSQAFPVASYEALVLICEAHPQAQTPALFLLRLLVAGDARLKESSNCDDGGGGGSAYAASVGASMQRLVAQLAATSRGDIGAGGVVLLRNVSATVMALCVVSNWLGTTMSLTAPAPTPGNDTDSADEAEAALDVLVDVAVSFLSHERVEVRQIAAALAYNYSLHHTAGESCSAFWGGEAVAADSSGNPAQVQVVELHAHVVQLLCCCLEDLPSEQDATVRKRRLALALRLLRTCGAPAVEFVRDLGFSGCFGTILGQLEAVAGQSNANAGAGNGYSSSVSVSVAADSETAILQNLIHLTRTQAEGTVVGAATPVFGMLL